MPRVGFEYTIQMFEREKTFSALHREATVIDEYKVNNINKITVLNISLLSPHVTIY
jgi:hypothetical protein